MTTIKEILDNLTDVQRRTLTYAFDNEITQVVILPGGKYIGVHLKPQPHLVEQLVAGKWSAGVHKGKQ